MPMKLKTIIFLNVITAIAYPVLRLPGELWDSLRGGELFLPWFKWIIAVGIESCSVSYLLKKTYRLVVPRMVLINVIEIIMQLSSIVVFALCYYILVLFKFRDKDFGMMLFMLIFVFALFCARVAISSSIFSSYDSSVDEARLFKVMIYANGWSYLFLALASFVSTITLGL